MEQIDYKEKYEKALERARQFSEKPYLEDSAGIVGYIFPELKESEDDKIRKAIKKALQVRCDGSRIISDEPVTLEEAIAWLEKRGEKGAKGNEVEIPNSEQKPAVIIPKFKIGDWVVYCNEDVDLITGIEENGYTINEGGYIPFVCESDIRLWTIQDAKDGDVLYTSSTASNEVFIFKGLTIEGYIECYCSYDSEDKYREGKYHFIGKPTFMTHPATKEQRDALFAKMKEAGYEWDAEKKELKKAEQKQVIDYPDNLQKDNWELIHEFVNKFGRIPKDEDELNALIQYVLKRQKPAWSEEDEQYKSGLIGLVENSKAGLPINLRGKAADKCIYWLKSLKDRYTWKPSDEQMEAMANMDAN